MGTVPGELRGLPGNARTQAHTQCRLSLFLYDHI
jgi:hypothetical protein